MSKKKNKKSKKLHKWYTHEYEYTQKKDKKSKKNKKIKKDGQYKKPTLKTHKESLSTKEVKKAGKIVGRRPDIDKELHILQQSCNHAGNLISIKEYRDLCLTPSSYTPKLDLIEQVFGDKALICKSCYQVVVSPENIDTDKLKESVAYLHAAAMAILPRKKFKDKEIRKINKLSDNLSKWSDVIAVFDKLAEKGAFLPKNVDVTETENVNSNSNAKAFFV